MMKFIVILSLAIAFATAIRLERITIYGDVENYEFLGLEIAASDPVQDAQAYDEVTFPDDPQKVVDGVYIIRGVKHHEFEDSPSNISLTNDLLGSKSISFKVWSPIGVGISSAFHFYGEKL